MKSRMMKIVDSHPWTIIERKLAVDEQYSDILSVLFVHKNIDFFFVLN